MKRDEISKFRVKKIIEDAENYTFPVLLLMLRRTYGMQRKGVSADIDLREGRLFYLEHGRFNKMPAPDELKILSEYYNFPEATLKRKAKEFLDSGACRKQGDKNG